MCRKERYERQNVAIAWGIGQKPVRFRIPPSVEVRDVMGNGLKQTDIDVADSPVYILAANVAELLRALKMQ